MTVESWVREVWSREDGGVTSALLAPLEVAYRAGVSLRNAGYDRGVLGVRRPAVPVISVGNIGVGGTGKTPFAAWLVKRLQDRGRAPALLHGGYADDEPALHRAWAPEVPVIAQRDRVAAAARAVAAGADVVVLDDAFQHRRIARDLDIVLVAVERWRRVPRLLPRGPWRESPSALRRADLVVCTRRTADAEQADAVMREVGDVAGRDPVLVHLRADRWMRAGRDASAPEQPVVAVSGLAEPERFEENAMKAGAGVADRMRFGDHHAYDAADARSMLDCAAGRPIVTTEKDWIKLTALLPAERVWVLRQRVEVEKGADLIDAALDRVLA